MARPRLLTSEIVVEARNLIATALYVETVAAVLGVARSTFHAWLKRGAQELSRLGRKGTRPKESEAIYVEFLGAIKEGRSQGEYRDLETIQTASKTAWQAAAWRLERRFPNRWGSDRRRMDDFARQLKELSASKPLMHALPLPDDHRPIGPSAEKAE
jgi:transposase